MLHSAFLVSRNTWVATPHNVRISDFKTLALLDCYYYRWRTGKATVSPIATSTMSHFGCQTYQTVKRGRWKQSGDRARMKANFRFAVLATALCIWAPPLDHISLPLCTNVERATFRVPQTDGSLSSIDMQQGAALHPKSGRAGHLTSCPGDRAC